KAIRIRCGAANGHGHSAGACRNGLAGASRLSALRTPPLSIHAEPNTTGCVFPLTFLLSTCLTVPKGGCIWNLANRSVFQVNRYQYECACRGAGSSIHLRFIFYNFIRGSYGTQFWTSEPQ